jgi:hypothetical protein
MAAEGGILGYVKGFGISVVVGRLEGMADQNHTRLLNHMTVMLGRDAEE